MDEATRSNFYTLMDCVREAFCLRMKNLPTGGRSLLPAGLREAHTAGTV